MLVPFKEDIPKLLQRNLPREFLLAVEEAFLVGAERAYKNADGMDEGHLPSVVGQLRHFNMNETFHRALSASGGDPTPIRGTSLVTGRIGLFTVGRFNATDRLWNNARRSQTRRQMALANRSIEHLVQPGLWNGNAVLTQATVFFVANFAASLRIQPMAPVDIQMAVPDPSMSRWLFRESVSRFVQRYDQVETDQADMARPKLKQRIIIRKNVNE